MLTESEKALDLVSAFSSNYKHRIKPEVQALEAEIAVHFEYGQEPGDAITKARPNEARVVQDYRQEVYEQKTFPVFSKILALVRSVLFNPSTFIVLHKKADLVPDGDTLQAYIEVALPKILNVSSFKSYFEKEIFPKALSYPNAWLAVLPRLSDEQRGIAGRSDYREPILAFIPSDNIVEYGEDFCLVYSDEKVRYVGKDGKYKDDGEVYFYFGLNATYRVYQVGEDAKRKRLFDVEIYHIHNTNALAIRQIGGQSSSIGQQVLTFDHKPVYLSFLQPAIPHLNSMMWQNSDIESVLVANMHPIRYEMESECGTCNGDRKITENGIQITCPSCKGTGSITSANSSLEVITMRVEEGEKLEAPLGFVSPPVAPFDAALKYLDREEERAYRALNMDVLINGMGTQQTARAKEIDRESLHGLYRDISSVVFDLFQWVLDKMNLYRYGDLLQATVSENKSVLQIPHTFDTSIYSEVITQLKDLKEAGFSDSLRMSWAKQAIMKQFGAESTETKLAISLLEIDDYALMTQDEILVETATYGDDASNELELYIHRNGRDLVDHLYRTVGASFFSLRPSEKKELAIELAESQMQSDE